jgi:two-component system, NarL family, invasion response regulator UvrY
MESKLLNIMLINNHDLIRSGIKFILKDENLNIYEASSFEEAKHQTKEIELDVIIISLNKFQIAILNNIKKLVREFKSKFLVLTDLTNKAIFAYLLKSGIYGILSMNAHKEEILEAITAARISLHYLSADIDKHLVSQETSAFEKLSVREFQVSLMIIQGYSSKEIAETLFLNRKSVNTYRNHIFSKLDVKNEVEMIRKALKDKLFEIK